jgi:hypothetical protein
MTTNIEKSNKINNNNSNAGSNIMKRADQRSSINILVLGDGTY